MKRYIAIMLALLMVGTTAGCSRAKDLFPESTATGKNGQTEAIDEEGLKIGYVLPSGTDGTDTISRVEGIRKMQVETGLKDRQILIKRGIKEKDCAETIDELVKEKCNIIFACSGSYENAVVEAAEKYPDVQFCQEDGKKAKKSGLANMHNYYVRFYEAYYAAGVTAGLKLNEMLNNGKVSSGDCTIGFVANKKTPESTSCINAFYLGVDKVCSQADMLVRYVDSTGVYDDDGEAAKQLVEAGAALMCQYTATTAVAAVCAENDIPIVGNDVNVIDVAPSEALTSAKADWSVYYSYAVKNVIKGKAIAIDWTGDYKDGSVILTQLNDQHLASGTVEKLQEVEKNLRSGKEKVFDTENFTIEGDSLEERIEEDKDYKAYKKNVKNGEYQESIKRSAPSMNFLIDGIEESTHDYLDDADDSDDDDQTDDSDSTDDGGQDGDE